MKTLLLMASVGAIWIHWLSQASSATITPHKADPAPVAPQAAAKPAAPVPALPRKIVKAAPSPKPSPSLIPVAAEECDQWCMKVRELNRRLSNDLDRYLYEDLKLS